MATYPNEWKILECDEKQQTTKLHVQQVPLLIMLSAHVVIIWRQMLFMNCHKS